MMREPGTESPNHRGPEAQRRVGVGGGLCAWGGSGLWRYKVWETLGSQTPTKTVAMWDGKTASNARAGTARLVSEAPAEMREMRVYANGQGRWNRSTMATALVRRRRSREGCSGWPKAWQGGCNWRRGCRAGTGLWRALPGEARLGWGDSRDNAQSRFLPASEDYGRAGGGRGCRQARD